MVNFIFKVVLTRGQLRFMHLHSNIERKLSEMAPTNLTYDWQGLDNMTFHTPDTEKGDETTLSPIRFIPETEENALSLVGYIKMGRLNQTEVLLGRN